MRKGQLSGPLATAFGGRDEVELGSYDATFASGWGQVDDQLQAWSLTSGMWDPLADRRKTVVRVLGVLAMIAGAVIAFFGGFAASRWGSGWIVAIVIGSLLGGGGFAAALRGLGAPGAHALRVRAVAARGVVPPLPARVRDVPRRGGRQARRPAGVHRVGGRPRRDRPLGAGRRGIDHDPARRPASATCTWRRCSASSTSSASTAPSSSGSGGGGGGSVGGGGGGGGGGSW